MLTDRLKIDGLKARARAAADSHTNVKATINELIAFIEELVAAAKEPVEKPEAEIPEKPEAGIPELKAKKKAKKKL